MRKVIRAGLLMAAILLLIEFLGLYLPKYRGFLRLFTILFVIDTLFWSWFSSRGYIGKGLRRAFLLFQHGIPYLLIVASIATGVIIPFTLWPVPFRTYFVSVVLMLILMKIPCLVTWPWAWLAGKIKPPSVAPFIHYEKVKKSLPVWWLITWSLGLVIMAVMIYGMVIGQHDVRVRIVVVKSNDLPAAFKGYRVVQLSDIHVGSCTSQEYLSSVVARVNELHPDLVVITGDLFNYRSDEGRGFEPILMNLQSEDGVYTILGNHDYGEYVTWNTPAEKNVNNQLALQWFKSVGWQLLRNEHRMIKRGTDSILLAGVENWGKTRRFQRKGDLAAALRGAENVPYQILLSHDPSHWDSIVSKQFPSVDLTLSGHTHGGQFGINTDGYKWSPSSWAYPHWMGLCSLEDSEGMRYLYVNPGIGTVGFAGRIGINPEITLLILQANP